MKFLTVVLKTINLNLKLVHFCCGLFCCFCCSCLSSLSSFFSSNVSKGLCGQSLFFCCGSFFCSLPLYFSRSLFGCLGSGGFNSGLFSSFCSLLCLQLSGSFLSLLSYSSGLSSCFGSSLLRGCLYSCCFCGGCICCCLCYGRSFSLRSSLCNSSLLSSFRSCLFLSLSGS